MSETYSARPVDQLHVNILSGQPGISRIAWSGDPVLPWKANLAALSQRENLYFIALRDKIYVDRPRFPDQALRSDEIVNDLRWQLPESRQAPGRGYHNRRYPHAVNRLLVGELGNEEVLICACDDGDIVIYNISSVRKTFEAIDAGLSYKAALNEYLRPSCLYNVEISAWGIATQSYSRLIATSTNKHEIIIKALGLSLKNDEHPSGGCSIYTREGVLLDRSADTSWKLFGHETNVPALAFSSTEDRGHDIYLLSSDINNNILIWNISAGSQTICKVQLGYPNSVRQFGWEVLAIMPSSFRLVNDQMSLDGCASGLECELDNNVVSRTTALALREDSERKATTPAAPSDTVTGRFPFSIVATSTDRVSMLHEPFQGIASCFISPWRTRRIPPFQGGHHGDFGTLKYARQIPELGVVIVASCAGYAGVFTLTRLNRHVQNKEALGLRLDYILPFEDQVPPEERHPGVAPWDGLAGLSTAPMQGSIRSRYRLVMEYRNRTVLSYELSRTLN